MEGMKVGIISMQRVINYGSYLQAYSLKNIIESFGNEVEFVDYIVEPPIVKGDETEFITPQKKSFLERVLVYLWEHRSQKSRKLREFHRAKMILTRKFWEEYFSELGVTPSQSYHNKEDVMVIGSDEVFNCLQANPAVGYSKELFGANANAKKVISYAASFGTTTLKGLDDYGIKREVKELLSKFDGISIRDKNSKEVIEELLGKEPEYHVDPVFLYDYNEKIPNEVPLRDYIIIYAYGKRITEKEAEKINEFARKRNKKIVTIGETQRFEWEHLILSPFEVLVYFQHADYIITDTFHGTVFSIKYNKKFATIIREGNKQKLTDLLCRFGLMNRSVADINKLEEIITDTIDYSPIQQKIEEERENSMEYLKKYVGE